MDGLNSFLQIGAFVIAMATLYKALSEYSMNNAFKRADVLEKLILRFNQRDLYAAKRLLEDFEMQYFEGMEPFDNITQKDQKLRTYRGPITCIHNRYTVGKTIASRLPNGNYAIEERNGKVHTGKNNIPLRPESILEEIAKEYPRSVKFYFISTEMLLRDHVNDVIYGNETYYRDSFDNLLDFVLLLIYYLRNEIITIREVHAHFLFTLQQVRQDSHLNKYIECYYNKSDFDWLYEQLSDNKNPKVVKNPINVL